MLRHVALLTIQGKEFDLMPIPLRTVRPFVLEDINLMEIHEEEGLDLSDQMEITKFLKGKVNRFPSCFFHFTNRNLVGKCADRAGRNFVG